MATTEIATTEVPTGIVKGADSQGHTPKNEVKFRVRRTRLPCVGLEPTVALVIKQTLCADTQNPSKW